MTAERDTEKTTKTPTKQGAIESVSPLDLLKENSPAKPDTSKTLLPGLTIDDTPPVVASTPHKADASRTSQQSAENAHVPVDQFQPRSDSISILRTDIKDPKAPTVAVLDTFKDNPKEIVSLAGDTDTARQPDTDVTLFHGEISRAAAEKNGFNTVAIQRDPKGSLANILTDTAKKIESGELKLGKGDVLNVSVGKLTLPTFEEASKFLGFKITKENLASEKQHILKRLNEIKADSDRAPEDRLAAIRTLASNDAVDKIQKRGVEVVHSAGNTESNHLDLDFLNATNLSSNHPDDGTADKFSVNNSLTEKANGVYPVHYNNDADLLSPTPIAKQTGSLEIGDTGVKTPVDPGKQALQQYLFDRNADEDRYLSPAPPKQFIPPLDRSLFTPETSYKVQPSVNPTNNLTERRLGETHAPLVPKKFSPSAPPHSLVTHPVHTVAENRYAEANERPIVGDIEGTSFSNIDYLQRSYYRLNNLKQAR